MSNNTSDTNTNSNKKFLITTIGIFTLLALFFGIFQTFNQTLPNKTPENKTNSGITAKTNSGTTSNPQEPEKLKSEDLYVVYNKDDKLTVTDDVLNSFVTVGKENNQNITLVDSTDNSVKEIVEAMGDAMYYPLFVFKETSPNIDFSKVDESLIVKSNGLVAFKEPAAANLPKLSITKNTTINAGIEKFKLSAKRADEGYKYKLLTVEDPLCPACAQAHNDKSIQDTFSSFTQEVIYFPLPSHKNSNKIIGVLRANKDVHYDLLGVIFKTENMQKLAKMEESKIYTELKKMAEDAGIKDIVDGEGYTEAEMTELRNLALSLGLQGTPSFYLVDDKTVSQLTGFDALDRAKVK